MRDAVWPAKNANPQRQVEREPAPPWLRGHWRGELSLPVSFFVNGVVGGAALLAILTFCVLLVFYFDRESLNAIYALAASVAAVLVFTIWLFVGVWRSAGRHAARGGSPLAALAARGACIAGMSWLLIFTPQVTALYEVVIGDPSIEDYSIHVIEGGTELEFFGGIKGHAARDLQAALDAAPDVRTVHLTSPGGRGAVAERMRTLIHARGLDTYVSRACSSACTSAFLGGRNRYVNGEKRIGFHGTSGFIGSTKRANDRYADALIEIGVEETFARKATATPHREIWLPSIEELIAAGVVTEVAEGQFAVSGFGATPDREKTRAAMASSPLYAALEDAEPEIHAAALDIYMDALRTGRTDGETSAAAFALVRPLAGKYMPVASDLAVNALGLALRDELAALAKGKADCHAIYLTDDGARRLAAREAIPAGLRRQTSAAISGVIVNGIEAATRPQAALSKTLESRAIRKIQTGLSRNYSAQTGRTAFAISRGEAVAGEAACAAMNALYTEIARLPPAEAAIIWRGVIGM